ncbi:MAG: prepilin-type N-terminal cleavage/methylation domain-containing protein [Phycisphaeraceae bacterium]|jgi:prepilin-type N-terminal cleavage/methylation domain-containing protein|nr:prepilin-type N-terminal cleavage/methylation domain-containing protein [Phycisphaeraceae bacterium]
MRSKRAFTLVEILIVVIILGILAALVVPQFTGATQEAASKSTVSQLSKIRNAIGVFYVRNGNTWPNITAGDGTWGEVITVGGEYMKTPPANKWVSPAYSTTIILRDTPDTEYTLPSPTYGWIYSPTRNEVWAAGFDEFDNPFPR